LACFPFAVIDRHLPEYQTLGERVSSIAKNPEHPIGEEFEKFTKYIRESCKNILECVESSKGSNEKKNTGKFNYLVVDIDGSLQGEYLTPLEKLCDEIKQHSERMAELFLEQFNSLHSNVLKCKLQLCYEENFYNEVGNDIMIIYEMAYKKDKEKMIHDLELLSTYPINCLDLGMKDEWWLGIFEKRRQETLSRRRSRISLPRPRNGSRLSSDSFTPPESENSSTSSGSSPSSHTSFNDHEGQGASQRTSHKEHKKKSPGTVRTRIISFMRRKSREVSGGEGGNSMDSQTNICYDDYDNYVKANKMSGTIEAPNGITNNNEHSHDVHVDKPNIDDNGNSTPTSSDQGLRNESEDAPQTENDSRFAKYFGPSLDCLKDVFEVPSVFGKLKCLTKSLTKVTNAVQELRQQVLDSVDEDTNFCVAITADDLLPLMVLIMLQMDATEAATMVVQLKMMQDLIPKFLSFGCHGWALVEFDMASKVLESLCTQFDWSGSFSP
jgi:hypothetical protein